MPDVWQPLEVRLVSAIADTDGDGAGKITETILEYPANPLSDHMIRRDPATIGTHHDLGGVMPAVVDKAVDVLKKADRAIAFHDGASLGTHHSNVRGFPRISF